ncbi:MAG: TraL conjugative transposon family protein [Bacteroidales bacterium]|jgi:hypothetical protein|nr:TraL conjugative transposon family protein [Bacteroidales bacterium]
MKRKINEFQERAWLKTEHGLRRLCGKPSPVKRLVAVLVACGVLAAANIYFTVNSIYSIGKRDAETELMKLQHIRQLKMENGELKMEDLQIKNNDEYECR